MEDNRDFFERVYSIVEKIPFGKVTTYGEIAKVLGLKSSARMVGWALNSAKNRNDLPFHRVVNRNGELTGKRFFKSPTLMRELLEAEGIQFKKEAVRMDLHLWLPEQNEE